MFMCAGSAANINSGERRQSNLLVQIFQERYKIQCLKETMDVCGRHADSNAADRQRWGSCRLRAGCHSHTYCDLSGLARQRCARTYLTGAELDAAANALGMTSADLTAELKSGKTLSQIATEKGVNLQTVLAAIQAARKADFTRQISQAVTAGKITQDKANWLLEGLDKGYINGPGFGFGAGFGGFRGTHNHAAGAQAQTTPRPTPQAHTGTWTHQSKSGGLRGAYLNGTVLDAAANALSMTSADLSAELKSGKTLSAIATEKALICNGRGCHPGCTKRAIHHTDQPGGHRR